MLGRLGADRFLGGEMKLDVAAAERALDGRSREPLGMSAVEAADGILRIAATAMSYAVKGVTTERGFDAGDFALVAYGGAGPLHAVQVAREIGMRKVIMPSAPGVFSAFGMLFSDLRYDFVRTWLTRLDDAPFEEIESVYRELEQQGREAIAGHVGEAAARSRSSARPTCAMSARSTPSRSICRCSVFAARDRKAIKRHFDEMHELRYGTSRAGGARRDRQPARDRDRPDAQAAAAQDRARPQGAARPRSAASGKVYFGGRFRAAPTYRRAGAARRQPHQGPGADRGTRLDDGADARRMLRGRCLRQPGDKACRLYV